MVSSQLAACVGDPRHALPGRSGFPGFLFPWPWWEFSLPLTLDCSRKSTTELYSGSRLIPKLFMISPDCYYRQEILEREDVQPEISRTDIWFVQSQSFKASYLTDDC
jgi:hypothetical protein